ncbi:unnamed protein product [Ambrosiozyma monospora]|uniref:Unnamed protein product n=1 Tax=Ambrosiozyma monospora TaxID=43982 RepID=A0ACB5SSY0_AMBMO|nr:unnamed protein product [Ambrosiozyma monospora]
MTLNVAIVGTGIFATIEHLPTFQKSKYFTPYSCYNRTKSKAEIFAAKEPSISKIYDSLEEVFEDPKVDLVDALLPVQYNIDVVKLAVKHKKNICFEKPIGANLDQAREIVQISKAHPELTIAVAEHCCYYKAIPALKSVIEQIGNVYSFTYHSTAPFDFSSGYIATGWRQHPQHIGGYLSDGGVHQLALLTGVLGEIKTVSAHTKQIRKESGDVDVLYSLAEMESGVIGTFTYGTAFGNTSTSWYFQIMGDNGSVYVDLTPGHDEKLILKVGGKTADAESFVKEIEIENEYRSTEREFEVLGESLTSGDKSKIIATPEVAFHHLAIIDASLKSSKAGGQVTVVEKP